MRGPHRQRVRGEPDRTRRAALHGKEKTMATKVARTGVRRERGWLYFLDKQGDVSRARMARGGGKAPKQGREKVAKAGVTREDGFLYFIDKQGDVARTKMARSGGKGRRKVAKRRSAAKKGAARRTAKRATKRVAKRATKRTVKRATRRTATRARKASARRARR